MFLISIIYYKIQIIRKLYFIRIISLHIFYSLFICTIYPLNHTYYLKQYRLLLHSSFFFLLKIHIKSRIHQKLQNYIYNKYWTVFFKFLYNKGGINSVKLIQERSLTVKTTFSKEYKIFIFGLLISRIGDSFYTFALPWIAYQLTGSAVIMSSLFAINVLPIVLFGPLVGVIIVVMIEKSYFW